MCSHTQLYEDIFDPDKFYDNMETLLTDLKPLCYCEVFNVDVLTSDLIDVDFLEEVRRLVAVGTPIYFEKSLRDLKCIVVDEGMREHNVFIRYKGQKRLLVTSVLLPYTPLQDLEYSSLEEIMSTFKTYVDSLARYFYELEKVDRFCTVIEPVNPTFKQQYRKILLDTRIWLHLEVTSEGMASNVYIVGQSEEWQNKLQTGLLNWNHDEDVVENIMTIFDLMEFPAPEMSNSLIKNSENTQLEEEVLCSICLCNEVSELGAPQPLCKNSICKVFFHRLCLFEWLISSSGGRAPAFGVATGNCPACFKAIACSEKEEQS